jgi:hypothetical protein
MCPQHKLRGADGPEEVYVCLRHDDMVLDVLVREPDY